MTIGRRSPLSHRERAGTDGAAVVDEGVSHSAILTPGSCFLVHFGRLRAEVFLFAFGTLSICRVYRCF